MNNRGVFLLSGGLDSTYNLAYALKEGYNIVKCLFFDYGQRAAKAEFRSVKKITKHFNLSYELITLPWIQNLSQSALLSIDKKLPEPSLTDNLETSESAKAVWIPNRNALFLNIAACFAESLKAEYIFCGFNAEEAKTFPDNSEDFVKAMNRVFEYSTMQKLQIKCFSLHMNKKEIVENAKNLNLPFNMLWPCYKDGDEICGHCESCLRFLAAGGRT